MQTYDDKVDAAVHAAFMALGLSVATDMELAYRLNDFITQEFQFAVSGDDDDPDEDVSTLAQPEAASGATGPGDASDD